MTFRVMKGWNTAIGLPGETIESAELRHGDITVALDFVGDSVIIHEDSLMAFPVPKTTFGELECELVVNGDSYPFTIVANPSRPRI